MNMLELFFGSIIVIAACYICCKIVAHFGGFGGFEAAVRLPAQAAAQDRAEIIYPDWARDIDLELDLEDGDQEVVNLKNSVDVHDSYVQDSMKASFEKLKEWFKDSIVKTRETLDKNLNTLKREIFNCKDLQKAERSYNVLRHIIITNQFISSISASEIDVLNIVFERCHYNGNNSEQLVQNLISQLADASETLYSPKCSIGRISRIIQTLEGGDIENIVNISSYDTFKNEFAFKIAYLRDLYDAPDSALTSALTVEDIRDKIDKDLRKDYVESGILKEKVYIDLVKVYLEAIE